MIRYHMGISALFPVHKPDIAALRDKRDFKRLIHALNHPDFNVQWQAADALGKLGSSAVEHLIAALHHPSRDVRLGIIEALGEIKDYRSVPTLLPLLKDESVEVRWAAALALGEIGDPRALQPVILSLLDPDKYVRYGAALALEEMGWEPKSINEKTYYHLGRQEWDRIVALGHEAVEPLLPLLKDHDPDVRSRVLDVIGSLGGEKAKKYCRISLADRDTDVRWCAVHSALECGVAHSSLPLGVNRRKRGEKSPFIAGFLNFVFPGIGYQYSGTLPSGAGFAVWQTYLLTLLFILLFVNGNFPILPAFFTVLYPIYGWLDLSTWMTGANILAYAIGAVLAIHVWYKVKNASDVL
ncbi:MAG: HEAT repeat domain-containing protein [Methanomicrobiales archaeon]|nr:HEAT repeat domain-containing protein [Methanomicrobiales archaeon]